MGKCFVKDCARNLLFQRASEPVSQVQISNTDSQISILLKITSRGKMGVSNFSL